MGEYRYSQSSIVKNFIGREYFNMQWLDKYLSNFLDILPQDIQTTLCELTADSMAEKILLCDGCERVTVCGGGAKIYF